MTTDLRSKVIRLAHSKPELRTHLLPLLTTTSSSSSRKADSLPAPAKEIEAKYKGFFQGAKLLFAACNKMGALYKREERLTGYRSRNTTSPADLEKLYTEINALQVSTKRLVDALVDGYPSWHKDAVTERFRGDARTALSQEEPIDVNTTYSGFKLKEILSRFHAYYKYVETVVHDLSGMVAKPGSLPPNPLHDFRRPNFG